MTLAPKAPRLGQGSRIGQAPFVAAEAAPTGPCRSPMWERRQSRRLKPLPQGRAIPQCGSDVSRDSPPLRSGTIAAAVALLQPLRLGTEYRGSGFSRDEPRPASRTPMSAGHPDPPLEPALHVPWTRYGCRLRTRRSEAMAPVVASQCGRKTDWHSTTSSTAEHVERPAPCRMY